MDYHGTCHCGACEIRFSSEKTFRFSCHCSDCRTLSSGGRFLGISINKELLTSSGPLKTYDYPGGSGKTITNHFCEVCGTRMFNLADHLPDFVNVMAMTLDTWSEFKPRTFIHTDHVPDWELVSLDGDP